MKVCRLQDPRPALEQGRPGVLLVLSGHPDRRPCEAERRTETAFASLRQPCVEILPAEAFRMGPLRRLLARRRE
jgi:hypothetical protein